MSEPVAWINERGIIYRFPKNKIGLRPLIYGDVDKAEPNAARYIAFRKDILTKHQPVMSAVASMLCQPAAQTTPLMIDNAFDSAIKRFAC